jgi:hypothetical protein
LGLFDWRKKQILRLTNVEVKICWWKRQNHKEIVLLSSKEIDFKMFGDRDFPEIWNLRILDEPPVIFEGVDEEADNAFEIVTNRDERIGND